MMFSSNHCKLLLLSKLRDSWCKSCSLSSQGLCFHYFKLSRQVSSLSDKCNPDEPTNEKDKEKPATLDKEKAHALILKLTDSERNILVQSLKEFDALKTKEEYQGQLAAFRWRSKFGRPSKVASLGDVDPTGSYCQLPEDWLLKKYTETVPKPTSAQLLQVAFYNAVPFIGFGFLDNACMILCGDYIEMKLGAFITVSTMTAAALGNTFSDILGIGSAYYVERLAASFGIKPPDFTPIQMDMKSTKIACNLGRVVGVTVGCVLGMSPLLVL